MFPLYLILAGVSLWLCMRIFVENKNGRMISLYESDDSNKADMKSLILLFVICGLFTASLASEKVIPLFLQLIIVISGISVYFFIFGKVSDKKNNYKPLPVYKDVFSLLLLVGIVSLTRFWKIGDCFGGVNSDELLFSETAFKILNGSFAPSVFVGESNHQIASPGYYITALLFKVFGVNTAVLRIFPAISAILSVIAFYLFLRTFFRWDVALLSSVFFAHEHTYMHLTRWMHVFQLTPAFVWFGLLFLVQGFLNSNRSAFVIAGAITGGSLYFYNSNKFLVVIFILYIIYEIIRDKFYGIKKEFIHYVLYILAFAVGLLIAFLPLGLYIANNFNIYFAHIGEVAANKETILYNIGIYLGMITSMGTRNAWLNYPGMPIFNLVPAFFVLLGVGISLFAFKSRQLVIAMLLLVIGLLPGIFSSYWSPPSTQRGIIVLTAAYLFVAIGINFLMTLGKGIKWIGLRVVITIIIAITCINEINTYFKKMLNDSYMKLAFSNIEYDIQNIYKTEKANKDVFVSKYFFGGIMGNQPFLGYDIYFHGIKPPKILDSNEFSVDNVLMFPFSEKDAVLLMESYYKESEKYLKARFPGAKYNLIEAGKWTPESEKAAVIQPDYYDRTIEMIKINISAQDIRNYAGLRYYLNGKEKLDQHFDMYAPSGIKMNREGEFSGGIRIFKNGTYRFKFNNFLNPRVFINGKTVTLHNGVSEEIKLYTSIATLDIYVTGISGNELVDILDGDKNSFTPVEYGRFVTERRTKGLRGSYIQTSVNKGTYPIRSDISPTIYHRWLVAAMEGRDWIAGYDTYLTAVWSGRIRIDQEGEYEFGIEGGGQEAQVYINGKKVYDVGWIRAEEQIPRITRIKLSKGFHSIRIDVKQYGIGSCTISYIRMPDGRKVLPIPEEMLYL